MSGRPLVACILIALAGRAEAQRAEADVEFQRGRALMAKGETAEACAAFEASMKLESQRGTLYNLGLCHEKLGKLASAWAELEELSRTDTNEARAKDAKQRAAALLPRLPKMHLVAASQPEGFTITRDGIDVTPLVDKQTPVDPGKYTFEARAPGRQTYTIEGDFTAEGKTVEVEIPALHTKGDHHDDDVPDAPPTGYPIDLPHRPILIPQGIAEISAGPSIATSDAFDRTAIDAGASGRVRLGPFEASAVLGFHLRSAFLTNKPNQWDAVGIGVRYPVEPALVVGLTYVERQPLRSDLRGSDVAANVERKLLIFPKVAVDGRAGFQFSQRENAGDEFILDADGRVQFSVVGALSLEGLAGLRLNVGGMLYDYTVGLDVAALALYAITPRFDVFAQAASTLLPNSNSQTYTFGASWRTH